MRYITLVQWHKEKPDGTLEWHNPDDPPMELPILDDREIAELVAVGTITPEYITTSTTLTEDNREVG